MCTALGDVRSAPIADMLGYSITSSAVASNDCGMLMPSAFAVLRLIIKSYLVGACTGISPGFSPLRMRVIAIRINRRHFVASDKVNYELAMSRCTTRGNDYAAVPSTRKRREAALNLACVAHV